MRRLLLVTAIIVASLVPKPTIAQDLQPAPAASTPIEAPPLATETSNPKPLQSMHLANGGTAYSYDHCGDMDLCAKVVYENGNQLSIYSEGAAECQPYLLHFVYADNTGKTLFEFSRPLNHSRPSGYGGCGHAVSTEMVFDRGDVHMKVSENSDGTIKTEFSVAKV